MRITIRQKNLEVTPALRDYIDKKVVKPVEKILSHIAGSDLPVLDLGVLRNTKHHRKGKVYQIDASLSIGKTLLRAEVDDEEIHAACDLLGEELLREVAKFKTRRTSVERRGSRRAKKLFHFAAGARLNPQGRVREEGI